MKPAKSVYKKYLKSIGTVWAGCFIVFVLVNILVMVPQKKNRKQTEKELTEKKKLYDSAIEAAQEGTRLRLEKQIEGLDAELSGFVTDFEDSANLTFDISRIATEKKVTSFSVKAADDRRGTEIPNCNYIAENKINVTFTAGYKQFATFLNALERHSPVIFIDEFVISRAKRDDMGHQVNMELTVLVKKPQES